MRWQSNIFQIKEQVKTPEELSEMEISNVPEKEFKGNDPKDVQRTLEKFA